MAIESIGARIKRIRLEKGLSLDDVHKKTKIHLNILKAIEEDSAQGLSPVYVKGFLKIYCKFLGVDPAENTPLSGKELKSASLAALAAEKKAASRIPGSSFPTPVVKPIKTSLSSSPWAGWKVVKWVVIAAIALVLFTSFVKIIKKIKFHHHSAASQQTRAVQSPPVKHNKKKSQKIEKLKEMVSDASIRTEGESLKAGSFAVTVNIMAKEDCFIQVKADGHTLFKSTLKKGRMATWPAKDKIELMVSNAAAVELEVNGRLFSNLGKRGQVLKNVVIDKEGLRIPK